MPKILKIEIDGQELTVAQIAAKYKIKKSTVHGRYRAGLRGDELVVPSNTKKYECGGVWGTVAEWAERTGIKKATILSRLRNGWTIAQATGIEPHRRKRYRSPHSSLCLYCKNALAHRCGWAFNLTPVPGWEATPVKLKNRHTGKSVDSFRVTACPNFAGDDDYEN